LFQILNAVAPARQAFRKEDTMNNEEKILGMLSQMQADMTAMKADMTTMKADMMTVKADMTTMKADMTAMKADMTTMKADMMTVKADMTTMKARIDQIDERSQRTAVLLETEVDRKLNLLYEGHDAIMECLDKLSPKSRVEILEGDVALLKDVIKLMRQEIADLKKAQ